MCGKEILVVPHGQTMMAWIKFPRYGFRHSNLRTGINGVSNELNHSSIMGFLLIGCLRQRYL